MIEVYGSTWTRQYGLAHEGAFDTWEKALLDFTVEQISQGFESAIKQHKNFPPNLPQFLDLCKPIIPACHQRYEALPNPPVDKEKARQCLQEIRQLLRGNASG